jgi:TIR domain
MAPPLKIFRDESHLAPGLPLPDLIREALDNSEFLILIASEASAASPWVQDELEYWCETLDRTDRLIIAILNGTLAIDPTSKRVDWVLPPRFRKCWLSIYALPLCTLT